MKRVDYLPSSLNAVEHMRYDVDNLTIKYYTLPEAPRGIFHPDYEEKCYTFAAAVSGNGVLDYLVYMALRPDWAKTGGSKDLDIDTATFCFKTDDVESAPSGVALFHQKFDGRTTPLTGYDSFTLEETVNDLHSKLIPGSVSLSTCDPKLLNAMTHSIGRFKTLLEPQIQQWTLARENQNSDNIIDFSTD